jgi:uncharacterized RDD family membrane protein YckC
MSIPDPLVHAGLPRRLAAMVYDAFLLFAVLFLAIALLLPFTGGEALPADRPWLHLAFQVYLLAVCLAFFAWFWVHGGQTLGMRAWRLRVLTLDGRPLAWRAAVLRFFAAGLSWLPAGLGFLWVLVDHDRLAWHDRLSGTALVVLPKRGARG